MPLDDFNEDVVCVALRIEDPKELVGQANGALRVFGSQYWIVKLGR